MFYEVVFTPDFDEDLEKFIKAGNKTAINKIYSLLKELEEHPTTGTGKPEQLKGYDGKRWSRRITSKHRLCYELYDDVVVVLVLSAFGHYED